ncbi:ThiF family adenylyltransferase [Saccharopolyspora hirsuta]|uniref:shikimate dehydrogenase family protein n=1 Tax=Saccharopolyspora hirsuta TaxID=1837 RepID=UPI001FE84BCB|nr:ThiF family adenylyltransferase [Saccharopolyspora hirsuta]
MGGSEISRITGRTRLFGVLGDPVEQVRAPELLNREFERLGADAVLVPVHAPSGRLTEVVRGLQLIGNLDGLLVTVPHKIAVCELADHLSPAVVVSGSANALRREPDGSWSASNFDGAGFVAGLVHEQRDPAGRTVTVVGAGGAGSALAVALLEAGVGDLRICDRDPARLADLRARVEARWPQRARFSEVPDLLGADLAVNATPLGLRETDDLPFDLDDLPPNAVVADIIMTPRDTKLLSLAASRGHPIHHGIHMLDHQIPAYLDFFGLTDKSDPGGAP